MTVGVSCMVESITVLIVEKETLKQQQKKPGQSGPGYERPQSPETYVIHVDCNRTYHHK